jgi:hypothetical protein
MKTKKELLELLNNLVITEIGHQYPEVQSFWEQPEFQKKFALTLGLKTKDILNVPKRNKSSYLFFCQELRSSIVKDNPGIKPNQVMVILGDKWSKLTDEEKKVYDERAASDKQRYLSTKENNKSTKPIKISSYLKFCANERPLLKQKYPELSTKEITAKLGLLWNELKTNKIDYLKSKYGYEQKGEEVQMVSSIPVSVSSRNIRAIQALIKN